MPLLMFCVSLYKDFLSIWFHYLYYFITQNINKIKKIFFIKGNSLRHAKSQKLKKNVYLLKHVFFPRKVLFTGLDIARNYYNMIWNVLIFLSKWHM